MCIKIWKSFDTPIPFSAVHPQVITACLKDTFFLLYICKCKNTLKTEVLLMSFIIFQYTVVHGYVTVSLHI